MNKKELISKTADILRERGIRKPVKVPRQVFHITDDEGNQKDFIVRKTDKTVMYNIEEMEKKMLINSTLNSQVLDIINNIKDDM